ncbi:DNA replication/repair protein RecF [Candidatus Odyssella acanthamoebae]|uniref:DNA replication/repair protein RecF n=1 Tax=Candidatus Odyssella acanthamoebae TaxID=91604 RepID=UPI00068EBD65|nr:DNA replication/repair protein RecF [Candidatus Paracaedibacter acanthamoebae]
MHAPLLSFVGHSSLLQTVTLVNFRNYTHRTFDFHEPIVALVGDNGVGKTNVLEAISLFSSGRGLRSIKLSEMKMLQAAQAWVVSANFSLGGTPVPFGTALDYSPSGTERRLIRINQLPVKNQATLTEWLNIVWVTPSMARLFQEAGSIRRKFIDRMVMALNPSHTERLNRYEHYLRERSQLLRQGVQDDQWLASIEQRLSEDGVAISIARSQLVRQLTEAQSNDFSSPFPRFFAQMEGEIDQWYRDSTALDIEDKIRQGLRQSRPQDAITGGAAIGAHRSDLAVTHLGKHMPSALCSTGEQKMLLHAITLAFIRLLDSYRDRLTLLLLDDVVAHLDQDHRTYLFQEVQTILDKGANLQIFMTGTSAGEFANMGAVQIIQL